MGRRLGSRLIWVVLLAAITNGCAGLRQFPERSVSYTADLVTLDPGFAKLLNQLYPSASPESRRNKEIETRLRVIDIHFKSPQEASGRRMLGRTWRSM